MSKYNDYGEFLQEVVTTANNNSKCSLNRMYGVEDNTVDMVLAVLKKGWFPFSAMTSLFGLTMIAFAAALTTFIFTPIGIIVIAALVYWGGKNALHLLYKNRALPVAVKAVGNAYKQNFDGHLNEQQYIDSLIKEAAGDLIKRATIK